MLCKGLCSEGDIFTNTSGFGISAAKEDLFDFQQDIRYYIQDLKKKYRNKLKDYQERNSYLFSMEKIQKFVLHPVLNIALKFSAYFDFRAHYQKAYLTPFRRSEGY